MKQEILDIRTILKIVLVIISLDGHTFSSLHRMEPGAQNLNFIRQQETVIAEHK